MHYSVPIHITMHERTNLLAKADSLIAYDRSDADFCRPHHFLVGSASHANRHVWSPISLPTVHYSLGEQSRRLCQSASAGLIHGASTSSQAATTDSASYCSQEICWDC